MHFVISLILTLHCVCVIVLYMRISGACSQRTLGASLSLFAYSYEAVSVPEPEAHILVRVEVRNPQQSVSALLWCEAYEDPCLLLGCWDTNSVMPVQEALLTTETLSQDI